MSLLMWNTSFGKAHKMCVHTSEYRIGRECICCYWYKELSNNLRAWWIYQHHWILIRNKWFEAKPSVWLIIHMFRECNALPSATFHDTDSICLLSDMPIKDCDVFIIVYGLLSFFVSFSLPLTSNEINCSVLVFFIICPWSVVNVCRLFLFMLAL
jgi:hypothetical protein